MGSSWVFRTEIGGHRDGVAEEVDDEEKMAHMA
jgi:hypothetical protein